MKAAVIVRISEIHVGSSLEQALDNFLPAEVAGPMEAAVTMIVLGIFIHVLDKSLHKPTVSILCSAEESVTENLFTYV